MQIGKHKIVSIDYTLTHDDGTVLDSSDGTEPLQYMHGIGQLVSGLEEALEGLETGKQLQVTVLPADGYGERLDDMEGEVSRQHFDEFDSLELGMQFRVPTDSGGYRVVTIVEIGDETVKIDANHPLAGINLNFDVAVRDVREATAEELQELMSDTSPDNPPA